MDDYYERTAYQAKRVNEYSQEWREQLEMLWKDIDAGYFGEQAKQGEWYKEIKRIRDAYPKPEA